ncbi:MAG: hypothetical protein M1434_14745 [Chloroflexi bacterium]|nr:hypothetical protein [Chloroflexota bacterium]MCL5275977.1 hypothetical protein [Chloroflexota bacterium]
MTSQRVQELIVYVCPMGELAQQLHTYFDAARAACGPNTAHRYMPHISLTGFFQDLPSAVPFYTAALDNALAALPPAHDPANPAIRITGMRFQDSFHYLKVESPWLAQLAAEFAQQADSPTRGSAIILKDFLHLSLAYGFPPHHGLRLAQLARELIACHSPAGWELRLYERGDCERWTQHAVWPL